MAIYQKALLLMTFVGLIWAPGLAFSQESTTPPTNLPLQKMIGGSASAKAQIEPSLIVMNSDGATLTTDKLTLTGIANNSIIFADRPVQAAGHALTAHLLEEWSGADDATFAKDPPNATVSAFSKDGSVIRDAVVVLRNPVVEGDQLTFDVQVLEGDLAGADGAASVFIDIIGLPFTPLSFAGAARRTARRCAWYGAATHPYYPPAYPPAAYYPPPAYSPPPAYPIGTTLPSLPAGCDHLNYSGTNYYKCSNAWFRPEFGSNGVYYQAVPAP
jgi:hypothetical protein